MSIVSNNIKYLRRLNGLTQEQFSRRIGIKRSLLGAYEEARANPNYANLQNIAKIFGISIDQLIKEDLRRIRITPDLVTQHTPSNLPTREESEPKSLAEVIEKVMEEVPKPPPPIPKIEMFTPPPVAEKPIYSKVEELPKIERFNNQPETKSHQQGTIQMVRQRQLTEYLQRFHQPDYLATLETFRLPMLPFGSYRAFEAGDDFAFPGAWLIGQFVKNWNEIKDASNYVLLLKNQGIVYRRVYNQVKIKGNLLLSSDNHKAPTVEIPIKDVLEVWEIEAFLSLNLPQPSISLDRIQNLVEELRNEIERLKQ